MNNQKPDLDFDPESFNILPYIQEYLQDNPPECPDCGFTMDFVEHHTPVYASLFKCHRCFYACEEEWNKFDVNKLFSK